MSKVHAGQKRLGSSSFYLSNIPKWRRVHCNKINMFFSEERRVRHPPPHMSYDELIIHLSHVLCEKKNWEVFKPNIEDEKKCWKKSYVVSILTKSTFVTPVAFDANNGGKASARSLFRLPLYQLLSFGSRRWLLEEVFSVSVYVFPHLATNKTVFHYCSIQLKIRWVNYDYL